jgi:hypothetical protein
MGHRSALLGDGREPRLGHVAFGHPAKVAEVVAVAIVEGDPHDWIVTVDSYDLVGIVYHRVVGHVRTLR